MMIRNLVRGARIAALAGAAALTSTVATTGPASAQGQLGAYNDAIAAYEQLLTDPNLDPYTRAQVVDAISVLQQSAYDLNTPAYDEYGSDESYDTGLIPLGGYDSSYDDYDDSGYDDDYEYTDDYGGGVDLDSSDDGDYYGCQTCGIGAAN